MYCIQFIEEMAAARDVLNFDAKLEALKLEIERTFDELDLFLAEKRRNLLGRLARMKEGHDRNVELDAATEQLRIVRDTALNVMTSNTLGGEIEPMREVFDAKIRANKELKVAVENLAFIEFRCFSGKIRKAIEETDLIELIPEYVGRDSPVLKRCSKGSGNEEFMNPRGISIDRMRNEVFIADLSNNRIQILNTEGEYMRSFGTDYLKEPHGICVSQDGVFVTDMARNCLLKFSLPGKFINQIGSRGTAPRCFTGIRGLCYESGLVYVCDSGMQRIQVFHSNLQFVKEFGSGEIRNPSDITIHSDTLHILSRDQNTIYCYNRDGTYLKEIELTPHEQQMTTAIFFAVNTKGNFIITDSSINEIRIFSPDGVLKHILGNGHLSFLAGITLDNANNIICVCTGNANDCFQKY